MDIVALDTVHHSRYDPCTFNRTDGTNSVHLVGNPRSTLIFLADGDLLQSMSRSADRCCARLNPTFDL